MLLVLPSSYEFFLLGQPVYQGYYSHHDMDNKRIGYAPLKNSGKAPLTYSDNPTRPISEAGKTSRWVYFIVIVYFVACFCLYWFYLMALIEGQWDKNVTT